MLRMTLDKADGVIYAPGVGKAKNAVFQERQVQVCKLLKPYEKKLYCLCDKEGKARLQHPLSPAVYVWNLVKVTLNEILRECGDKKSGKEKIA